MSNLNDAEALLIARLLSEVPALANVLDAATFAEALDVTPLLDAAVVLAEDAEALQQSEESVGSLIEVQRWSVIIAVRNVASDAPSAADRAGARMHEALRALIGWRPSAGHGALRYVDRPPPDIRRGYSLYPMTFELDKPVGP